MSDAGDTIRRYKAQQELESKFELLMYNHSKELHRARNQLIYKGRYGESKTEKWDAELRYFVETVVPANLKSLDDLASKINRYLDENRSIAEVASFEAGFDGVEFETFCAGLLIDIGFSVQRTPASGDHGVDLLAEFPNGDLAAVQCKMKSAPVGNSAVQEVVAGAIFYGAMYGVVVSNNSYTPGAIQLAQTNGVALCHYEELQSFFVALDRERNNS